MRQAAGGLPTVPFLSGATSSPCQEKKWPDGAGNELPSHSGDRAWGCASGWGWQECPGSPVVDMGLNWLPVWNPLNPWLPVPTLGLNPD